MIVIRTGSLGGLKGGAGTFASVNLVVSQYEKSRSSWLIGPTTPKRENMITSNHNL